MGNFKSFLIEKNRLMQKYEKGEINILSYNIPIKKGKEYQYDNTNEILKALGINPIPTSILNKFKKEVSSIPFGASSNEWNYNDEYFAKEILNLKNEKDYFIKETINFATNKTNLVTFNILSNKDKEKMYQYYSDPKNIKTLEKQLDKLTRYSDYINDFQKNKIQKAEAKLGIKWNDIVEGFKYIDYFRGMSQRKLPKNVWPFLHAITVKMNKKLPKTIYRGIFLDGKDVDKDQDYSVGNKIKLNNKKATSWSTSIGQAIKFSGSQGFIKDEENGYQLVIKYDIQNKEDIIADFRVFQNMDFYNQQEIVLSPKVKYGVIVYSKQGDDYETSIKKNIKSKYGDSPASLTYLNYLQNPNKIKDSNLSLEDKMKFKEIYNMSLKEVMKKYPEFLSYRKDLGCLPKVNSYLAIPMQGFAEEIKNCSYTSLDLVEVNLFIGSDIKKELESFGMKLGNVFSPKISIKLSATYTVKPKGYASEVIVKITDFNIIPEVGEDFEHNTKITADVKEKILKSKNLKMYVPNSESFPYLKVTA